MKRRALMSMLWALWILVMAWAAGAAEPLPRLEVEGPRNGLLSFTLRGGGGHNRAHREDTGH